MDAIETTRPPTAPNPERPGFAASKNDNEEQDAQGECREPVTDVTIRHRVVASRGQAVVAMEFAIATAATIMRATSHLFSTNAQVLAFGSFRIETAQRRVLHAGKPLRLGSRAREILFALLERAGETVMKHELIERIWPGFVVGEGALRVHIVALRKALGEGEAGVRYIENVSGHGYRFTARVEHIDSTAMSRASSGSVQTSRERREPALIHGRDVELRSLLMMLEHRRLVSIVGPGGVGKTALAMAAVSHRGAAIDDAVTRIDLASIGDEAALLALVPKHPPTLVVLDNCEHMIESATRAIAAIRGRAPEARILVTSREPLRAMDESILRLMPLQVPAGGGDLCVAQALEFPAIKLFVERATQSGDHFHLTQADLPSLVAICQRLEGIPLWIELAAARVGLVGMPGLTTYLDTLLTFLTVGRRTAPVRHQSLRATLDWSFDLLCAAEQTVFCQLATLDSSFDLARAQRAVAHAAIDPDQATDLINSLVAKSLIFTAADADGTHFRLPHIVRAHALERARMLAHRSVVAPLNNRISPTS